MQVLSLTMLSLIANTPLVDINCLCVQNKTTVLYTAMTQDLMPAIKLMSTVQLTEETVISTVMTRMHVCKPT